MFSVGAVPPPSLNVFVLAQRYKALHLKQPSLKIEIRTLHSDEMYAEVENRQVDVAFTLRKRLHSNVNVQQFFLLPWWFLALQAVVTSMEHWCGRKIWIRSKSYLSPGAVRLSIGMTSYGMPILDMKLRRVMPLVCNESQVVSFVSRSVIESFSSSSIL